MQKGGGSWVGVFSLSNHIVAPSEQLFGEKRASKMVFKERERGIWFGTLWFLFDG